MRVEGSSWRCPIHGLPPSLIIVCIFARFLKTTFESFDPIKEKEQEMGMFDAISSPFDDFYGQFTASIAIFATNP